MALISDDSEFKGDFYAEIGRQLPESMKVIAKYLLCSDHDRVVLNGWIPHLDYPWLNVYCLVQRPDVIKNQRSGNHEPSDHFKTILKNIAQVTKCFDHEYLDGNSVTLMKDEHIESFKEDLSIAVQSSGIVFNPEEVKE
jgi:hypothetical protein